MSEDVLQNWVDSFQELCERVLGKSTCLHCGQVVRDWHFHGNTFKSGDRETVVEIPQPKDTGNE